MRWTQSLEDSAAYVFGLGSNGSKVKDIPGDDDFEKIALAQWLLRLGFVRVQRGTGRKAVLDMYTDLVGRGQPKPAGHDQRQDGGEL